MTFAQTICSISFQAIKQKLQIHRNRSITVDGERSSPQEEDKAKMLFGNRHAVSFQLSSISNELNHFLILFLFDFQPENKSTRKGGVFKFPTKQ